jgi:hypothetical protein
MSGPKVASYAVTEARRRALAEAARQDEAKRHWRLAHQQREQLRKLAATSARRYAADLAEVPVLAEPAAAGTDELNRLADAATAETERLRRAMAGAVAAGAAARARRLTTGLGSGGGATRVSEPATPGSPSQRDQQRLETDLAESVRLIGRLDLDTETPAALTGLVGQVASASPERRPLLLAAIRDQLSVLNEAARERRHDVAIVEEVALIAADLGDTDLAASIAVARAALAAGRRPDVTGLRRRAEAAQARQQAAREREFVRRSLVEAFAQRGYRVLDEPDVLTPAGGVLVEQDAVPGHGVLLDFESDGRVRLVPVRLTDDTAPTGDAVADDTKAEEAFCADIDPIVRTVQQAGIDLGPVRGVPAGMVPPRTVPVGAARKARKQRRQTRGTTARTMQERKL